MRTPVTLGDVVREGGRQPARRRPRPAGGWAGKIRYSPDADFGPEAFQTPVDEYVKRFNARVQFRTSTGIVRPTVDAVLLEPVRESQRWRPRRVVGPVQDLRAFFESESGQYKRILESGDSFDLDYSGSGPLSNTRLIDQEYVPLMAGPFHKQLYIRDYLLMHARAFELRNHNALASSAIKILTRFVIGRGLSFHVKNEQAQAVWDEFWEREDMRRKLREIVSDLSWQGELLLKYSEPVRGFTTLRNVDASTCWEIVTDPEDVEQVYYYHFQWPTPYQMWTSGTIPISRYIIKQIPPTVIQHVKLNVSSTEKRGRTDLLPAMPWLKRFNDFYDGQTVKALLEANLTFKVKVHGDQNDVDALLSNPNLTELPPPGGVWIENEGVNLEPLSATLTASRGSGGIGQQIASIVATSLNLPAEYFNIETAGPARATALVRTDPAVKAIEDRQQIVREFLEDMYDRVMASAYAAGRISSLAAKAEPETVRGEHMARRIRVPRIPREPVRPSVPAEEPTYA